MAKENFDIPTTGGRSRKFGIDRVTKKLSAPESIDATDFIDAITDEHITSGRPETDYPLGPCVNIDNTTREVTLAPGWTMTTAQRTKLRGAIFVSRFP
jgi:hypothetical protein